MLLPLFQQLICIRLRQIHQPRNPPQKRFLVRLPSEPHPKLLEQFTAFGDQLVGQSFAVASEHVLKFCFAIDHVAI